MKLTSFTVLGVFTLTPSILPAGMLLLRPLAVFSSIVGAADGARHHQHPPLVHASPMTPIANNSLRGSGRSPSSVTGLRVDKTAQAEDISTKKAPPEESSHQQEENYPPEDHGPPSHRQTEKTGIGNRELIFGWGDDAVDSTTTPTSTPTPISPPSMTSSRPNGSPMSLLLGDWEFCSTSDQCTNGCCSLKFSDDGKLKCTPLNGGYISSICIAPSDAAGDSTNTPATSPTPISSTSMPSSPPPNISLVSQPTTTDSSPSSNASYGVGAAVIVVVLLVMACAWYRIRAKKGDQFHASGNTNNFSIKSGFWGLSTPTVKEYQDPSGVEISSESRADISSNNGHNSGLEHITTDDGFLVLFEQIRMLGQGAQGQVFECREKPKFGETHSLKTYAIKRVATTTSTMKSMEYLQNEIKVMRSLGRNNHTVELHGVVEGTVYTYLMMGLFRGGDVNQWIRKNRLFSEADAQKLCQGLLEAVQFCHIKKIAHRDIKLANLLLEDKNDLGSVKLAHFGFAKEVPKHGLTTRCGTPNYMPPEIILVGAQVKCYGIKCDMWSVGVVVYHVLVGEPLFVGNEGVLDPKHRNQDLYRKILECKLPLHDSNPKWATVSEHAKTVIRNLVKKNPQDRWSAQKAIECEWIQASTEQMDRSSLDISSVGEDFVYEQRPSKLLLPSYQEETDNDEVSWNFSVHQ